MKLQYSSSKGCLHCTLIQEKCFFNVKYTSDLIKMFSVTFAGNFYSLSSNNPSPGIFLECLWNEQKPIEQQTFPGESISTEWAREQLQSGCRKGCAMSTQTWVSWNTPLSRDHPGPLGLFLWTFYPLRQQDHMKRACTEGQQ